MDMDQYFRNRADLVCALFNSPGDGPFTRDWRFFLAGLSCIAAVIACQIWASTTQVDPGFFARISAFNLFGLAAGVWLLTAAQTAYVLVARCTIVSRDAVREKTLHQLLKVDGSLAHKLLPRSP